MTADARYRLYIINIAYAYIKRNNYIYTQHFNRNFVNILK